MLHAHDFGNNYQRLDIHSYIYWYLLFRPHRMHCKNAANFYKRLTFHSMVCVCVCLCVGHIS